MKRLTIGRLPWLERARIYAAGGDGLRELLIRGASGTFALKIANAGLGLLTSLVLARLLGVAGYGAYAYAISWLALLVVPAALGLDTLLVRNVATYRTRSEWGLVRGILWWANRIVLTTSVGLAALAATIGFLFGGRSEPQMLYAFLVAMIALPLLALTYLRQGAMRGFQRVVTGYLPENLLRPLFFLVFVGAVYLVVGDDLTSSWAVASYVVATLVTFLIGTRLLYRTLPPDVARVPPVYAGREWIRSVLPLLFLGGMHVVNAQTSIVLLGIIQGAEETGTYAVAARGALLISFALTAVNAAISPAIASVYATGDLERLQRMVTKSARLVLLFSLPLALCFVLFGQWVLLLFGEGFAQGGTTLAILSLGQLINAATGSVAAVLIMTGYERDAARCVVIGAVLNIALNVALIPVWGSEGAALATAASVGAWNLLLTVLVYRRLGIHASALGRIGSLGRGGRP